MKKITKIGVVILLFSILLPTALVAQKTKKTEASYWISYPDYKKRIDFRGDSVLLKGRGTVKVVVSKLNVRTAPNTSAPVVAQYSYGQMVNLDATWSDSYGVWGSYVGQSGQRRYVAILGIQAMGVHGITLGDTNSEFAVGTFKRS